MVGEPVAQHSDRKPNPFRLLGNAEKFPTQHILCAKEFDLPISNVVRTAHAAMTKLLPLEIEARGFLRGKTAQRCAGRA
jgi:hypothetical protein